MSAERDRATRLKRLLDVQERKRRLAEWALAERRRDGEALALASAEIIESLGSQSLLNGLFLEAKATALRRNEAKVAANRAALEVAARQLSDAREIEKRIARAAAEADTAAMRRDEKDAFATALDDFLAGSRTSLE